jgi:hypothetical protein
MIIILLERKKALRELCPCHVKHNVKEFWDRIIEMTKDEDRTYSQYNVSYFLSANVRYQVLHNLCDGSPLAKEDEIIAAIEST